MTAAAASGTTPSGEEMTSLGSNGLRAATAQALSSAFRTSACTPALSRLTRDRNLFSGGAARWHGRLSTDRDDRCAASRFGRSHRFGNCHWDLRLNAHETMSDGAMKLVLRATPAARRFH